MFLVSMASIPIAEVIGANVQNVRLGSATASRWLDVATLILIAPVVEEVLFRGFALNSLLNKWHLNFWIAVVPVSLVWAAFHMPTTTHGWIVYFALSLILSYLYYRTGKLWTCIAAHSAYNLVPAMFALIYMR